MIKIFALLVLCCESPSVEVLPRSQGGAIAGQLVDMHRQATHAGEVVVFLCEAKTSLPLHRETKKPVQLSKGPDEKLWYAVTDERGAFAFNDVPAGQYRLIAQSWSGTRGMPKLMGNTSTFVILHGVAERVTVKQGERAIANPRQLGNGVLRITNDPKEGHAFLLISLKPTLGDAILGPFGWGDDFVKHVIGVTHMEKSHVTLIGLPDDRDVNAALLNYDNNPGFGAGAFKAGQREGKLRIVASWSNGHRDPPPELKMLTAHLERNKLTPIDFLIDKEANRSEREARQQLLNWLRDEPGREVEVPGLGRRRLVDVMAALAYIRLGAANKR